MSELRWIILGIGVIVIAAVYFFSRRKNDHREPGEVAPPRRPEAEPYLGGFDAQPVSGNAEAKARPAPPAHQPGGTPAAPEPVTSTDDQLILTVHVTARTDAGFAADAVATALAAAGLRFGRYGIYHFSGEDGADWFSAANMVEPGRFPEPDSDETAPGITLFMMMPGLAQPQHALDTLLSAARRLAADLDADLTDSRRKPFTAQAAQRMREQLAAFHARHTPELSIPSP